MKRLARVIAFTLLALFLSGCASIAKRAQERSAFDFKCPVDEVKVRKVTGDTYYAEGCGKSHVYNCVQTSGRDFSAEYSCFPERNDGNPEVAASAERNSGPNPAMPAPMMMAPPPPPMH